MELVAGRKPDPSTTCSERLDHGAFRLLRQIRDQHLAAGGRQRSRDLGNVASLYVTAAQRSLFAGRDEFEVHTNTRIEQERTLYAYHRAPARQTATQRLQMSLGLLSADEAGVGGPGCDGAKGDDGYYESCQHGCFPWRC